MFGTAIAAVLCLLAVGAWAMVPTGRRAVIGAPADQASKAPTSVTVPSPAVAGAVTTGPTLPTLASGLVVRAAIAADGGVLVNEQLSWSTPTLPPNLTLNTEPVETGPGIPTGEHATPNVTEFEVLLDGQVISIPYTTTVNGLRTWTVPTSSALGSRHVLQVRYVLTGARVSSMPAPAGRATVVIEPMLVALTDVLPAEFSVTGPAAVRLLGVNCPIAPTGSVVCGSERSNGWVVAFGPGRAAALRRVTVQLDLP